MLFMVPFVSKMRVVAPFQKNAVNMADVVLMERHVLQRQMVVRHQRCVKRKDGAAFLKVHAP